MECVCGFYEALPNEVVCKRCYDAHAKKLSDHTDLIMQRAQKRLLAKSDSMWDEFYAEIQFPFPITNAIEDLPASFQSYINDYNYLYNFGRGFLFSSNKDYKHLIYSIMKSLFNNFHIKSAANDVSEKSKLVECFSMRFLRTLELGSMYVKDIQKDSDIVQCHLLIIQIDECTYSDYVIEIFNNIIEWRTFADMPTLFFTPYQIDAIKANKVFKKIVSNSKIKIIKGV